jgi:threonine synthase
MGKPTICLATADPIKFETAMRGALGPDVEIPRPQQFEGLEQREQRYERMDKNAGQLKQYIEENMGAA